MTEKPIFLSSKKFNNGNPVQKRTFESNKKQILDLYYFLEILVKNFLLVVGLMKNIGWFLSRLKH